MYDDFQRQCSDLDTFFLRDMDFTYPVNKLVVLLLSRIVVCNLFVFEEKQRQIQIHIKKHDMHIQFYRQKTFNL